MTPSELRRLLELAAKAMGYTFDGDTLRNPKSDFEYAGWNPADDDGDSRRLEVALGIKVMPYPILSEEKHSVIASRRRLASQDDDENTYIGPEVVELYGNDPYAATRLAVLRAAAAIGYACSTRTIGL